jgi:acyl transferase domain-containing protein/acyl carrier protein
MTDPAERIARLSPAKRALLALEMQKRGQAESPREEPIAVIGMGCRFPGARDPEAFWRLLRDGVDAITEVPPDRWDLASLYDPDPEAPGKMYTRWGGFLEDVDRFDASFFGLTPAEAANMDPQHRLLLEVAWEALESAGQSPDSLMGSATGIFVGISNNDYSNLLHAGGDATRINAYLGTGTVFSAAAGRLSYLLGLQGPSLTLDTACSSSLVTVHLACQSLRQRESDLALAGGVNLILTPETTIYSCRIKVMAADGRCKSFDASADGYVRGEGCGLVVLKRLSDALAAGDPVLAVLRGSAVNQDGRSGGLTAPNGLAQQALIRRALDNAGLDPAQIDYVEAHGSATPLGDPIEAQALGAVLARGRSTALPIGSVKSNVGHLESAAGIAGLIKVVLALGHRQIPPSLHFRNPNPHISFDRLSLRVQRELAPWPDGSGPARAGVSSFGFVGTNAHVVVEEAPAREPSGPSRPWQLLLLSARTATALDAAAARLAEHLEGHPDLVLADAAYTLQVGRRGLGYRRALVCRSREDAIEALAQPTAGCVHTSFSEAGQRPVVFMFPGLGDHYAGMAAGLYRDEPVFRQAFDRCSELLRPHLGLDLGELLYAAGAAEEAGGLSFRELLRRGGADAAAGDPRLRETWLAQPAVFAVEHALAQLLIAWGVRPQAMIGYSLGEYVAACLAGVLSLEDALFLVARRARLISDLPAGAMLAVALPEGEVAPLAGGDASLAAANGPALSVWAGPLAAIETLERRLAERGVAASRLQTSHAFHSRMMDPIAGALNDLTRTVRLAPPRIPYLSNVTGAWITAEEATDPSYWARHMCGVVRFGDGLAELLGQAERILLEVGPGQSLVAFARQHPAWDGDARRLALPALRHEFLREPDTAFLLGAVGRLWLAGAEIDWEALQTGERRRRIPLPTYPFERESHWFDRGDGFREAARPASGGKQPDVADWSYLPVWKPSLTPAAPPAGGARSWLVLVDERGLGRRVADRLREDGQRVTVIAAGARFRRVAADEYVLDPRSPEDFVALLGSLEAPPERAVHLWSLSADVAKLSGPELLDDVLDLGFYGLLSLAKAVGRTNLTAPLGIWVVSDQMQKVHGMEELRPEAATLLGPCKVIPQEYLNVTCHSVDIVLAGRGSWQEERLVRQLAAELVAAPADLVVAYRGADRWVQGFEPARLPASSERPARLRERGVYLITGGLGGIGLTLAERLAERVQARIALLGRSALPPREAWGSWLDTHPEDDAASRRIRRLQAIEARGAEVLVLAADVGSEEEMTRAVSSVYQRFGTLHGVVHAAGITSPDAFVPVQETGREECERHFLSKIRGLYALEKVLRGRDLDFWLLQSSLSTVLGGLGFVAYVAANAFMDAFAHRQNQAGPVPWLTVDWDLWLGDDGGASGFGATIAQFTMSREEGLEVTERILALDAGAQVVISTGDLGARIAQWVELRSSHGAGERGPAHARPQLANPYAAPASDMERAVAGIWQDVLGIDQVGRHDDFFELGGHSLIATQIFSRLRESFRVELPMRSLFEAPTVAGLSGTIETVLWAARGGGPPPVALVGEWEELEL